MSRQVIACGTRTGNPITLSSALRFRLAEDTKKTLTALQASEQQVQTSDDQWFTGCFLPHHRIDDVIDGVVVTRVDITPTKRRKQTRRDKSAR
jgi:hypothetical protein